MRRRRFWKRTSNYRPVTLLQQLEERIVLDAAVNTTQDNPDQNPDGQSGASDSPANSLPSDKVTTGPDAASGGIDASGNGGLVAQLPQNFDHVFGQDLNVVLVANNLADVQTVKDAATSAGATALVFDAANDGLADITSMLNNLAYEAGHQIDNLAIVAHGSQGVLSIGVDQIQFFSLDGYQGSFQALGKIFSQDAQIQFYGCSLAGNAQGQSMVDKIATFTGAEVFASNDTTGGNAHDWTLEYASDSAVVMNTVLNADILATDITPLADAVLVQDINTATTSYPAQTGYAYDNGTMGGKVFFSAADGIASTDSYGEPWVYDISTGTAGLLKDISPYSSVPKYFTVSGSKVFFQATDWVHGYELFVSDGVPGGDTHMIMEANGGLHATSSSTPTLLTDVGGTLYFVANDGSGQALWRTDGTDPNTVEFATGTAYNPLNVTSIANLTNVNGTLYFTGTSAAYGQEVYMIDGSGNIALAANIHATSNSSPTSLTAVGSALYLVANDGGGIAIHQIVGTTATEIPNSLSITAFANLTNVNGTLFFAGTTSALGQELYKVTGGAEVLVQDIRTGTTSSSLANLTAVGSTLYFTANDGTGNALWQSDGTVGGATKVPNLTGSDAVTSFTNLTNINGKLYFTGSSSTTGSELYKVEGGSIALAQDIYSGTTGSGPTNLMDIGGGKIIFTANNGFTGNEPWVYDGTNPATSLDVNHLSGSVQYLTNLNGILYFVASDGGHGMELWKSDPATGVTSMVMDLSPGTANGVVPYSSNAPLANVNGTLFFLGSESTQAAGALYKIDNSTGLPVMVKDVAGGTEWLTNLTAFENTLYFVNYSAGGNYLWRSDGTADGTVPVTDPTGTAIKGPSTYYFTEFNGTLYFQGGQNGFTPEGSELYKIDANGNQVLVQDLAPGSYVGSTPSNLTNVNGTLYFVATVGGVKGIYYTSDGVTINQVTDTIGVTIASTPWLTNHDGTLFFVGSSTAAGSELFYVDGSNTIQVVDVLAGTTSSSPGDLYSANGTLFFSATDTTNGGKEPWVYDSVNGAHLLKDINPGNAAHSFPSLFKYMDGLVYFKAQTATGGYELWQTDGDYLNPAGTVMIGSAGQTEIYPGATGSNPADLTVINNTLFFTASAPGIGAELWKLDGAGTNTVPTVNAAMNQTHTIDEDTAGFNLDNIVIDDLDVGDTITATLALNSAAAGALSANDGATYNVATGFWSVSGTVGAVNTALANVTFTPSADWFGTVNITTHVHDAKVTGPVNGQITINVTGINDATTVDPVAVNLDEDPAAPVAVVLSGNPGPANEQGQTLTYVLGDLTGIHGKLYSDPAGTLELISGASLIAPGAGLTPVSVYYVPDADYNGPVTFNYSATDDGGTPVQGVNGTAAVTLDVAPVNDAPVNNNVPGIPVVTDENSPVVFSGPNAITISDVDLGFGSPTQPYSVTLATAKAGIDTGTIQVTDILGVTITGGLNDGTATTLTLTGTLADINASLDGMTFIPFAENYVYAGVSNANLTIETSDGGNIGIGGVLSATNTIDFTVTPVPDAPVNTVGTFNVPPGTGVVSLAGAISVHDGDVNDTLFVSLSAGPGVSGLAWGAMPTASPQLVFAGMESFLNPLFNNLVAYIQPGFYGQATVQVTTTDLSGLSNTSSVLINVGTASLPPAITAGTVGAVSEDQVGPVDLSTAITVSDPNGDPLTVDLVASAGWSALNATGSGTAVVTGGGTTALQITGSMVDVQNALATLNGTLIADFNGDAGINVTADDGVNPAVNALVSVPVTAVNDAPVLVVPGSQAGNINTTISITGISVADIDVNETPALNNVVYMQLDVIHGTLSLADTNGLTFDAGHGNGTGSLWFIGNLTYVNNALAAVSYTPELDYGGSDTLSVSVNDMGHTGQPGALTATSTVDITTNAPPQVTPGAVGYTVYEDQVGAVDLGACVTVSDANGDPLTVDLVASAGWSALDATAFGAVVITGGGTTSLQIAGSMTDVQATLAALNGTLIADFNGTATFNVTVSDGFNPPVNASVDVPILAVNDAPVADTGIVVSGNEDNAIPITLGMTDPQDAPFAGGPNNLQSVVIVTGPAHGTLTQVGPGPGDWSYTPDANWFGTDSFVYTVQDDGGVANGGVDTSAPESVTINVASVNDAPVAQADAYSVNQNTVLNVPAAGVLTNDTDVDLDVLNAVLVTGPTNGLLTLNADGSFSYTPTLNFSGSDSFTYMANDGLADSNVVAVDITVNATNTAPVAQPDSYVVDEDTVLNVPAAGVLANDTDLELDVLNAVLVTGPTNGALTLNADGSFVYTPSANFNGNDSFTYMANDGLLDSNVVAVDITVNPVNDAPVLAVPGAQTYVLNTPLPITGISVTDLDADETAGPNNTVYLQLDVAHGTLSLANTAGLTFDAGHGDGTGSVWFTGNLIDVGNALATVIYTPATGYGGADSVSVAVNDQGHTGQPGPLSAVGAVNLTLNVPPQITAVNMGPFAEDAGNVNLGGAITVSDPDGGSLTLTLTASAGYDQLNAVAAGSAVVTGAGTTTLIVQGSVADINATVANLTGHLAADFNGSASVNATISDGLESGNGNVLATVTAVNDAPVTTVPGVQSTAPNTPIFFSSANGNAVTIADVDAGTGQIWCRIDATNGTISLAQTTGLNFAGGMGDGTNDPSVSFNATLSAINAALNGMRFTPNAGFTGAGSFVVKTYDWGNTGAGGPLYGAEQTVTINVAAGPAAPVAGNFSASINEDAVATLSGWNFTDANGDAAEGIVVQALPTHGTLFLDANSDNVVDAGEQVSVGQLITWADASTGPKVKYLGNADYFGADALSYVVRDVTGQQGSTPAETGTASINVVSVNDAPVVTGPAPQATTLGTPVVFNSTNGNAVTVADVDAGTNQIWCRLDATNGTLSLSQTTGLNFAGGLGDGTNDVSISFNGTLAAINAAFNGLVFTPNAGFTGAASFVIKTYDWGFSGLGGALYGLERTVDINVA